MTAVRYCPPRLVPHAPPFAFLRALCGEKITPRRPRKPATTCIVLTPYPPKPGCTKCSLSAYIMGRLLFDHDHLSAALPAQTRPEAAVQLPLLTKKIILESTNNFPVPSPDVDSRSNGPPSPKRSIVAPFSAADRLSARPPLPPKRAHRTPPGEAASATAAPVAAQQIECNYRLSNRLYVRAMRDRVFVAPRTANGRCYRPLLWPR